MQQMPAPAMPSQIQETPTPSSGLTIGTGDNANLAYGLPLFPAIGSARDESRTPEFGTLLDFEITILFLESNSTLFITFLMGVLGPAIAFNLPADVTFANLFPNYGEVAAALYNQNVVADSAQDWGLERVFRCSSNSTFQKTGTLLGSLHRTRLKHSISSPECVDIITVLVPTRGRKILGSNFKLAKAEGTTYQHFQRYRNNAILVVSPFTFWGISAGLGLYPTTTATPSGFYRSIF